MSRCSLRRLLSTERRAAGVIRERAARPRERQYLDVDVIAHIYIDFVVTTVAEPRRLLPCGILRLNNHLQRHGALRFLSNFGTTVSFQINLLLLVIFDFAAYGYVTRVTTVAATCQSVYLFLGFIFHGFTRRMQRVNSTTCTRRMQNVHSGSRLTSVLLPHKALRTLVLSMSTGLFEKQRRDQSSDHTQTRNDERYK